MMVMSSSESVCQKSSHNSALIKNPNFAPDTEQLGHLQPSAQTLDTLGRISDTFGPDSCAGWVYARGTVGVTVKEATSCA